MFLLSINTKYDIACDFNLSRSQFLIFLLMKLVIFSIFPTIKLLWAYKAILYLLLKSLILIRQCVLVWLVISLVFLRVNKLDFLSSSSLSSVLCFSFVTVKNSVFLGFSISMCSLNSHYNTYRLIRTFCFYWQFVSSGAPRQFSYIFQTK